MATASASCTVFSASSAQAAATVAACTMQQAAGHTCTFQKCHTCTFQNCHTCTGCTPLKEPASAAATSHWHWIRDPSPVSDPHTVRVTLKLAHLHQPADCRTSLRGIRTSTMSWKLGRSLGSYARHASPSIITASGVSCGKASCSRSTHTACTTA